MDSADTFANDDEVLDIPSPSSREQRVTPNHNDDAINNHMTCQNTTTAAVATNSSGNRVLRTSFAVYCCGLLEDSHNSHNSGRDDSCTSDVQSVRQAALQLTTTLTKDTDEFTGNKIINQYLLPDDIGEGASGKVKLAYSLEQNITVAIKVVRRLTPSAIPVEGRVLGRDTVRHEISLMKRLRHPNLVSLFEVIDDPNAKKMYLVMRFADKGSVGAMREDLTCDAMPLRALVDMAFQVCCGLQYLHDHGIYHRDIKPENILRTSDGQYMIGDFGISVIRQKSTSSGNGSTNYALLNWYFTGRCSSWNWHSAVHGA